MSNGDSNEVKAYEARLRSRLKLLKRELESGNISIPPDQTFIAELQGVKLGPDGEVDLATVSSRVRAMALAAEAAVRHQESLGTSLAWVQTSYFGMLEDLFGNYYHAMLRHNASAGAIANTIRNDERMRSDVVKTFDAVARTFRNFWNDAADVVAAHLGEMKCSKALFGGDIGPQPGGQVIGNAALAVDVALIPDPVDRVLNELRGAISDSELVYLLVKHALGLLQMKPLFFANVDFPIAVVIPGIVVGDSDWQRDLIMQAANEDALFHVNSASGADFSSLDDAAAFFEQYPQPDELERKLQDPSRVICDKEWQGSLADRIKQLEHFRSTRLAVKMPTSPGSLIIQDAVGRMAQSNALLQSCDMYGAIPLLDAPTSWQWLQWKFEYDSARGLGAVRSTADLVASNALTLAVDAKPRSFSRLSVEGVVALRESGKVDALRQSLRAGLDELLSEQHVSHEIAMARVIQNLNASIKEYDEQVDKVVRQQYRFVKLKVPLSIGGASVVMAGPITGSYGLTVLGAAASCVFSLPTIGYLWREGSRLVKEGTKLARTPLGIMIDAE